MAKCQELPTKDEIGLFGFAMSSKLPCLNDSACSKKTDEEIVKMAKNNKDCFRYLVSRYEEKMKKYVSRISGNSKETVDDLVQDIFIRVYTNLDKFDTSQKFSPWIYRIAHNITINYWLANKKRQLKDTWDITDAPKHVLKTDDDLERELSLKITNERLRATFENLQDKYRDVLVMNYLEQKNYKEIATELGKPISTIGTLLSKGKKMLKIELLKAGLTPETIY